MGKGVLQPCRRAQGTCPKKRFDVVRENTLAGHCTGTFALSAHTASDIRGSCIAAFGKVCRVRRWCPGREGSRLKDGQKASDDVSRTAWPRAAAYRRRPRFMVPHDDCSSVIHACTLVDNESKAVILTRHLI